VTDPDRLDAPNQQVVRADASAPWEEGDGGGAPAKAKAKAKAKAPDPEPAKAPEGDDEAD
jgi:hypothetical protein